MKTRALRDDHIVGIGAILQTLEQHGSLSQAELLAVCHRYGLRAGSVPWAPSVQHAVRLRLLVQVDGALCLTPVGQSLSSLVVELEPTDALSQALVLADLGSRQDRRLAHVELEGAQVRDPRLVAGQLLGKLADVGLCEAHTDGTWLLAEGDFDPLLQGLMCQTRGGNPALKGTGDIGELLTRRYYEEDGWRCLHVSKISDVFGFDLLFRRWPPTGEPSRAVEAKATRSAEQLRIFLSVHELRVAQRLGERYEILVWGSVKLDEDLDTNYTRLRAHGYPVRIADPIATISRSHPDLFGAGLETPVGHLRLRDIEWVLPPPPAG